jgi:hypothetical protein
MPLGRQRSNAAKPSAENLERLTNSLRDHRALPVTLSCGLVNSAPPTGSFRHLASRGAYATERALLHRLQMGRRRPMPPDGKLLPATVEVSAGPARVTAPAAIALVDHRLLILRERLPHQETSTLHLRFEADNILGCARSRTSLSMNTGATSDWAGREW